MRSILTDTQFTEAVYRHYRGETLSEIAFDFGISLSSLSQIKKRREIDWERIRHQIISIDIAKLDGQSPQHPPQHIREILSHILLLFIKTPTRQQILDQLCADKSCSLVEAESYLQTFETLFPLSEWSHSQRVALP